MMFTAIVILALTIALYVYSRHALDYEKITIEDKQLFFERSWGGKIQQYEFNTPWTRLVRGGAAGGDLALKTSTCEVPIGFFVRVSERERFEQELESYLGV